ncbi:putative FAD/NAD(P)-binding domain superfamily [Helianthus annuus]|nr:putative FAD/NAD(P)-binding domain superfamily [Helianthus annuus]
MGPLSRGHLELRSTNPNDNPAVTFITLKIPETLEKCVEGIRIIERVIESRSFSRFRYNHLPVSSLLNMTANSPVLDSLRVIDGSTFDYSPGTNPQATVMMLGRYMGVKMLHERIANN